MVIDRRLLIEEDMDAVKQEVRDLLDRLTVDRAGAQSALVQKAFVKRIPSRAMRSWLGVRRIGWPATLIQSARWPSV